MYTKCLIRDICGNEINSIMAERGESHARPATRPEWKEEGKQETLVHAAVRSFPRFQPLLPSN